MKYNISPFPTVWVTCYATFNTIFSHFMRKLTSEWPKGNISSTILYYGGVVICSYLALFSLMPFHAVGYMLAYQVN